MKSNDYLWNVSSLSDIAALYALMQKHNCNMSLLIFFKYSVPKIVIAVHPRSGMGILTANLLIENEN